TFLLLTFLFPYISCFQILDLTLLLLILKEVYCCDSSKANAVTANVFLLIITTPLVKLANLILIN
ncbi:MAG: hypothetical protein ACEY3B_03560, partial [Wolbachia sp.]